MLQQLAQYKIAIVVNALIFTLILLLGIKVATAPLRIEAINLETIAHFTAHLLIFPLLIIYAPIHALKASKTKTKHLYLIALLLSIMTGFVSATYTHTLSNPGAFLFKIHANEHVNEQGDTSSSLQLAISTDTDGYDYDTGLAMYFAEAFMHGMFYTLYALSYLQFYALSRKRNLRKQLKQQQLDILSHQLNPHFLFNSLNSIRAMLFEDTAEAKYLLNEFRSLFKSHFANKRHKIPLHSEISLCKRYLNLEHVRFEERLKVDWQVEKATQNALIPNMSLFTLIENAIKHGIAQMMYGGTITINIEQTSKQLIISVSNPVNPKVQADGTKTGLVNLENRLTLLYDQAYSLVREAKEEHYQVRLTLPLKLEAKHA